MLSIITEFYDVYNKMFLNFFNSNNAGINSIAARPDLVSNEKGGLPHYDVSSHKSNIFSKLKHIFKLNYLKIHHVERNQCQLGSPMGCGIKLIAYFFLFFFQKLGQY
jgi:hypothetical protein